MSQSPHVHFLLFGEMIVALPRLRHTSSISKLSRPSNGSNDSGTTMAVRGRPGGLVLTRSAVAGTGGGGLGGGAVRGLGADVTISLRRCSLRGFSSNCGAAKSVLGLVVCCGFMVNLFALMKFSICSKRSYIIN